MDSLSAVTWNCSCRRLKEQSHRRQRVGASEGKMTATRQRGIVYKKEGGEINRVRKKVKKGLMKCRSSERETKLSGVQRVQAEVLTGNFFYLTMSSDTTHTNSHSWSPLTLDLRQYIHKHSPAHTMSLSLLASQSRARCQPPYHIQIHTHPAASSGSALLSEPQRNHQVSH